MAQINPEKANVKASRKGNVPLADINFGKVASLVSDKWSSNNWLTLKWLTVTQFSTNAQNYNSVLNTRLQKGATRPQITKALKIVDKTIDGAVSYVKMYITEKYKKENAQSYYAAFGIEYKTNKYKLPKDQNKKLIALDLIINALQKHGFADKEYGVAFWTPIKTEYKLLMEQAIVIDGEVAVNVVDKNTLKNSLKKGLNAIINALKANYPDSYKQELRNWGFQKEKY